MMGIVAIRADDKKPGEQRFRAIAGKRQSVGRTMGEALDALAEPSGDEIEEATVLIQRFLPDAYFTKAQHLRMQDLLARRCMLTEEERAEMESLVDAELDATFARTDPLVRLVPL
jgi:hypothetical protein